jgi:putative FmdB family regulatory protein
MPTYEYACVECDKTQEVTRSFKDTEIKPPCPQCGYAMTRVFNTFGINLKGGGYYSTDNRKP